jgi:hypothetical protein
MFGRAGAMDIVIPYKEDENLVNEPDYKNQMPLYTNEFIVYENFEIFLGDEDIWGNQEVGIHATTDKHRIFNPNAYHGHLYFEVAKIHIDEETRMIPNEKNKLEEIRLHRLQSKKSKESLLKFSKRFGLLGVSERKYFYKKINEKAFTKGYEYTASTDIKMDIINQELVDEIFRMKLAVKYLKKLADGIITEDEKIDLMNIVNDELPFKQDRLQLIEGKFYPSILFSSLIDLAWWQFREALFKGIEFKHCKNDRCGNIFAVTHGNQAYCPPYPGQKRSNCENAYNRRLKYQRNKPHQK